MRDGSKFIRPARLKLAASQTKVKVVGTFHVPSTIVVGTFHVPSTWNAVKSLTANGTAERACYLCANGTAERACYLCRLCLLRKILLGSLSKSNGLLVSHLHERFVKPPVDPDIAFVCNLDRSLLQFVQ